MPNWKKVATSGSAASFSSLFVDTSITASIISSSQFIGNLSGTASYALSASYAPSTPGIIVVGTGCNSTVRCGVVNCALGDYSFAGGGRCNTASGVYSFTGGGLCNTASGGYSVIGGGSCNTTSCFSFIGAGFANNASGINSAIVAGNNNCVTGNNSTILGGSNNFTLCTNSVIVSGYLNRSCNCYASVVNGYNNTASGKYSFIGGGSNNCAAGCRSAIVAGVRNCTSGFDSFVGGGACSCAIADYAVVGGGQNNTANGLWSFVGGGCGNTACGACSGILGGINNTVTGTNSFAAGCSLTVTANNTFCVNQLDAQGITGSLFGTASYALTASYAANAAVLLTGSNAILNQTSAATTWSFNHNLNNQYPVFQVFDSSNNVVIPQNIEATNTTTATIYFPTAIAGTAVASIGGYTGSVTASYVLSASYADTASYFNGSVTSASHAITADTASYANQFNVASGLTASGLIYPTTDGTYPLQVLVTDGAGVLSFDDVHTLFEDVYNGETTTLTKGTLVYVSGSQGSNPKVYRADASNASKMPVTYVIAENIGTAAIGRGVTLGLITGIDLSAYAVGTELYTDGNGTLTATRPTGSADIIQPIGIVTKTGNGGQLNVLNPGPVLLPNIQTGYTWIGDGSNQPVSVSTSSLLVASASRATSAATASYLTPLSQSVQLTGSMSISGSLTVSGSGTLINIGPTQFTGSLGVTGSTIITGSLSVTGSSTLIGSNSITGSFNVSGSRILTGFDSITGSLGVTGSTTLTGSLSITGSNTVVGSQRITGSIFITGSKILVGSDSITGSLNVSGSAFITGSTSITGSYTLVGNSAITGSALITGNVGIGTASPSYILSLGGDTARTIGMNQSTLGTAPSLTLKAADSTTGTNNEGGALYLSSGLGTGNGATSDIIFSTAPSAGSGTTRQTLTERVRITNAGNVGIGTASPSQKFEVVGGEIKAGRVDSSQEGGQVSFGRASDNNTSWYIDLYGSSTSPQLRFVDVDNSAVRMTLTGSNVGIGTSTPASRLTIAQSSDAITNGVRIYRANGSDWQEVYMTSGFGVLSDTLTFYSSFSGRNIAGIDRGGQIASITAGADASYNPAFVAVYTGNNNESNAISTAVSSTAAQSGFRFDVSNGGGSSSRTASMYINRSSVSVVGSLSKGSGSFRIKHPLLSKKNTHHLVHSFIEGPQADLIYRGKVTLVNGRAIVNIDEAATMTEGTFEILCREVQCFTSNETSWDAVRGKVVGNILTIECQNTESTDEISWLVIGERQDEHMLSTDWTDENGKVIVEPLITVLEDK